MDQMTDGCNWAKTYLMKGFGISAVQLPVPVSRALVVNNQSVK
jgi:hypothetical protein